MSFPLKIRFKSQTCGDFYNNETIKHGPFSEATLDGAQSSNKRSNWLNVKIMWKQFSVLREKEKNNFADERRERSIDSLFKIKLAIQIRCCCNLAVIVRPILLRERSAGWFSNFVRRIWARFSRGFHFIVSLHFIGWKEERAHSFNLMALSLLIDCFAHKKTENKTKQKREFAQMLSF